MLLVVRRCGSNSSIHEAGCVCTRMRTSARCSTGLRPLASHIAIERQRGAELSTVVRREVGAIPLGLEPKLRRLAGVATVPERHDVLKVRFAWPNNERQQSKPRGHSERGVCGVIVRGRLGAAEGQAK